MEAEKIKQVLEAALMITDAPISLDRLMSLFEDEEDPPKRDKVRRTLEELEVDYENAGIELVEVASGYRFQARAVVAPWMNRLFDERKPRYSRALLETIAIIAYRQPITRGEIENIRGVAVSTGIVRTLLEREWVRIVGHRDVPGKPSVYATTKMFLDYFNLASIDQLPSLAELKDFDDINPDMFAEQDRLEREAAAEINAGEAAIEEGSEQASINDQIPDEPGAADDEQPESAANENQDLSEVEIKHIESKVDALLAADTAAKEASETEDDESGDLRLSASAS